MDCSEVREKLFAYLDGEMQGDVEKLERHFKLCLPCFKRVTLEKAFLKVIRARASGKPVPPTLEQRIRREISDRADSHSWFSPRRQPLLLLAAASLMVTALGFTAFDTAPSFPAVALQPSSGANPVTLATREGHIDGRLICIHCAMDCDRGRARNHVHCNGIQTPDGRVWHILETESTRQLIHSPSNLGQTIHVDGLINIPAQTVAVARYNY